MGERNEKIEKRGKEERREEWKMTKFYERNSEIDFLENPPFFFEVSFLPVFMSQFTILLFSHNFSFLAFIVEVGRPVAEKVTLFILLDIFCKL